MQSSGAGFVKTRDHQYLFIVRRLMWFGRVCMIAHLTQRCLLLPAGAQGDLPAGAAAVISIRPTADDAQDNDLAHETVTHHAGAGRMISGVRHPTITAFFPDPHNGTGLAVVIAPGGGFNALSIDVEGFDVARRLQERGIAAFVLKYRLGQFSSPGAQPRRSDSALEKLVRDAADDAREAVRVVRRRAVEWAIDPHRIGILGFSAGGEVANSIATRYETETKPDFVGSLYGVPFRGPVPRDAPPLFLAVAADDRSATVGWNLALFRQWRAAGRSAELHVFASGGHGFAGASETTSSGSWLRDFVLWLQGEKMLTPL